MLKNLFKKKMKRELIIQNVGGDFSLDFYDDMNLKSLYINGTFNLPKTKWNESILTGLDFYTQFNALIKDDFQFNGTISLMETTEENNYRVCWIPNIK